MNEQRNQPRKRPHIPVRVTNAMTGRVIGQIGNLSPEGMLLLSDVAIVADGLYQFAFDLPDANGRPQPIEVGVHESWTDATQTPGHWWTGFRFIDLGDAEDRMVRDWLHRNSDD